MGQSKGMRAADLIQQAYEEVVPREFIDIPLAKGEVMRAKMEAPDIFAISKEQEVLKSKEYYTIIAEHPEFENMPILQSEWEEDVATSVNALKRENFDSEDRYNEAVNNARKKSPPKNRAEQIAEKQARMLTIRAIIPKYLRDPETDELLFPTVKERDIISRYMVANMKLFKDMMNAYVRLFSKMDLTTEAKNSSGGENAENTDSLNTLPGDTVTEAPLTLT